MTQFDLTPNSRLTPEEVRDAYLGERYRLLLEDNFCFKVVAGPKLVVHLFATAAKPEPRSKTPVKKIAPQNVVPLLPDTQGGNDRMTFDGRVFFVQEDEALSASTLLMHSGLIEAMMGLVHLRAPAEFRNVFSLSNVEESVVRFVAEVIDRGLAERTCGFPFRVRVALLDTTEATAIDQGTLPLVPGYRLPVQQKRRVLVLPDVEVKDEEQDVSSIIPAALERMWHAWGRNTSPNYQEAPNGTWVRKRGR